jgi:hypothetical protein
MNEQFRLLARQAMVERASGFKEFDADLFAKLIVKECCQVLEQTQTALDRHKWPSPSECGVYIKEHFGVE